MFYNQYTFNSFYKSEPLNLPNFMVRLIEDLGSYYSDWRYT